MKKIKIKVIPNARKNSVSEESGIFKVRVTAPAVDGKANKAVIEVLSEFYQVKKREVKILRGEKSREKLVEIISLD
ncbi:MAG: DUF167 domain-containing protein [bacterium]|nr:DUF167 domain-containing protein [bacterium]